MSGAGTRAGAWAAALAALALAAACANPVEGPPRGDDSPRGAALRLFDLAHDPRPDPAQLDALFGLQPSEASAAQLGDALEALGELRDPRVVDTVELAFGESVVVDLVAALPGEGEAGLSVAVERDPGGTWRIAGFSGPSVDWPRHAGPRGDGLTSSAPPAGPRRGDLK